LADGLGFGQDSHLLYGREEITPIKDLAPLRTGALRKAGEYSVCNWTTRAKGADFKGRIIEFDNKHNPAKQHSAARTIRKAANRTFYKSQLL